MNFSTLEGVYAIASRFGPNLMAALTTMTLAELHRFLGYRVEDEISPKADGDIAALLKTVQRPLAKQRQASVAEYQEGTLLTPSSLDQSVEQGYQPAITLMANHPLAANPVPGVSNVMGMAYVSLTKSDDVRIVVSDGVGRISGLELLERKFQKSGDAQFRQKRIALESLRIPVLILFPINGVLTEAHMQQALYDQNVLATPLQPAQALTMDRRSPYTAIFRGMFEDSAQQFDLQRFGVNWNTRSYGPKITEFFVAAPMIKFVKIATEGPKFAESARGGNSAMTSAEIKTASLDLALFWSTMISAAQAYDSIQFSPGTVKDNLAMTGVGLTALGILAYELFRGESGKKLDSPDARLHAIRKIGRRNWTRQAEQWRQLGIVDHVSEEGGSVKYVIRGAGASNARVLTQYLMEEAGLREADTKSSEENAA